MGSGECQGHNEDQGKESRSQLELRVVEKRRLVVLGEVVSLVPLLPLGLLLGLGLQLLLLGLLPAPLLLLLLLLRPELGLMPSPLLLVPGLLLPPVVVGELLCVLVEFERGLVEHFLGG